jgi:hypothetical protein
LPEVSGTDGSNDGWLIVVIAAVSAGVFLWARERRFGAIGPILGGVLGAIVTIYDRGNLSDAGEGELGEGLIQVGWGLNLAMIASISLALAGAVWLLTNKRGPTRPDEVEPAPSSEIESSA